MVKVNRHVDRVAGHLLTPGCQASPETEADPGRAFAFECSMMEFHYSTWGYRFEPTESGCRVTEWSDDLRPEAVWNSAGRPRASKIERSETVRR